MRHADVVAPPADVLLRVRDAGTAMAVTGTVTGAQRELFFSATRLLVEERPRGVGRTLPAGSSAPTGARRPTRSRSEIPQEPRHRVREACRVIDVDGMPPIEHL